jgi:hypothetical protein
MQMVGVAQVISSHPDVMQQYLFQVALADEWFRVLLSERRVTLGLITSVIYLGSTLAMFVTIATTDSGSSIFLVPHLLAVVASSWMNFIIFWNRLDEKKREKALGMLRFHSDAVMRALWNRQKASSSSSNQMTITQ